MLQLLRYLWAFPTTLLGLFFVPLAIVGGGVRWNDGVLELHSPAIAFFLRRCTLLQAGASAMTLGHVVLARTRALHEATRAHERVHVRQCERWGPLFLPAYAASSLACLIAGKDVYRDNRFEREAWGVQKP